MGKTFQAPSRKVNSLLTSCYNGQGQRLDAILYSIARQKGGQETNLSCQKGTKKIA